MSWRWFAGSVAFAVAWSLIVLRTLIRDMWGVSSDLAGIQLAAGFFTLGVLTVLAGMAAAALFAWGVWPDVSAWLARQKVRRSRKVASHA